MALYYHSTLCIYRNNNTSVSRSYNFITVFVGPHFTSEFQKQLSVNDCPQMHSVSCCVSVIVCRLLLCPVVCQWQFAACFYVLLCVGDRLWLVVMSCCVSVIVCSLLLCLVLSVSICSLLLCPVLSVTVCSLLLCPVLTVTVCSLLLWSCPLSDSWRPVVMSCSLSDSLQPVVMVLSSQWQFAACCYGPVLSVTVCSLLLWSCSLSNSLQPIVISSNYLLFFLFFTRSVCPFPNCTASISPLVLPPVLAVSLHWIPSHDFDTVLRRAVVWWSILADRVFVCVLMYVIVIVIVIYFTFRDPW